MSELSQGQAHRRVTGAVRFLDDTSSVTLEEFNQYVERERPETLEAAFIAKVKPNPWVLRGLSR